MTTQNNDLIISLTLLMSQKYNYDNFTLTVDFKNDFALAITASDIYSGDSFIN